MDSADLAKGEVHWKGRRLADLSRTELEQAFEQLLRMYRDAVRKLTG